MCLKIQMTGIMDLLRITLMDDKHYKNMDIDTYQCLNVRQH